ncbi:MAG: EpsG family protein [Lachnospiraceae bacterium]|nr:EpsG family protein [Butyrivibrio sp.]MCM1343405.1 EpsG family protein [Muribaculaceae bacterium]MCM1410574.1 EpsG family protein [Lachnospiraceae bacterium]
MKLAFVLIVIICGLFLCTYKMRVLSLSSMNSRTYDGKELLLFLSLVLLILISALRGDFSTDYKVFYHKFYVPAEKDGLLWVLSERDWGFAVLCYVASQLFHSYQWVIAVMGIATVMLYGRTIKRYSVNYMLSIVLLVGIDNYIVSFNIIRNIFSAALCFYALKEIYENSFRKYFILVLLASTVHRTALLMLPMYWVLRIDIRKKKNIFFLIGVILFYVVCFMFTNSIGRTVMDMLGMDSYGTDLVVFNRYFTGNTFYKGALKTSALFGFVVFFQKLINFNDLKERVWFNACAANFLFQILTIKIGMAVRLGYYFSACFILLIPLIISRMKNKKLVTIFLLFFLLIYCGLLQNGISEYWFFWQNRSIPV